MSENFWRQIHGGSTHFPIVLLLASVIFDLVAWRSRDDGLRRGFHWAGFGSAVAGALGGLGAVIAGLVMTHGRLLGSGSERVHHLFVWPAIGSCVAMVAWRLGCKGGLPRRGLRLYFAGMSVATVLMMGSGYSGGEMLLGTAHANGANFAPPGKQLGSSDQTVNTRVGQKLFLKNCAHCHGADGKGDEGPDLHNLDWTDEQITMRILSGKKGQMTAFAGKLRSEDISSVIAFLRTLK